MIDILAKKIIKPIDELNRSPIPTEPFSAMTKDLYKYSGLLTYLRKNPDFNLESKFLFPSVSEDLSSIQILFSEDDDFHYFKNENIELNTHPYQLSGFDESLLSGLLPITYTHLNLTITGNNSKNIEIYLDGNTINWPKDSSHRKTLILPQINIHVDKNSSASVVLSINNFEKGDILLPLNATINLGERSNLSFLSNLNSRLKGLISEINLTSNLKERSIFSHFYFQNEGLLSRNNTHINMRGEYAEANLYGLSVLSGKTEVDNYSHIRHLKPNCTSNQLYKTVVNDKAKSIFNGRILVEKDSQKTLAYQTNKSLVLSPDAKVRTKPQLEIFADDVKCSHGATIGQIDQKELFYLQCRGISRDKAKSLLVEGFTNEILDKVTIDRFRELIREDKD